MKETVRAKVVAIQPGIYTNFVFQNLDVPDNDLYRYLTITMCPNWICPESINIGDEGYVVYEYAKSGEPYIEASTGETKTYKYSAYYFMNFIKSNKEMNNVKEFKF